MTTRTKRLLSLAALLFVIGCSIAGWTVVKVVSWARDLPNRIVIDGDAVANSFGHAIAESYHHALRDGDPSMQLQILNKQFAPAIAENRDALTWIRNEYREDIIALVESDDAQVSAAASDLIEVLDQVDETPTRTNGG